MDYSRLFTHLKFIHRESRNIKDQVSRGITTINQADYNLLMNKHETTLKVLKIVYNLLFDIVNSYASQDLLEIPRPIVLGINISGLTSLSGYIFLDDNQKFILKKHYSQLAYNLSDVGLRNVSFYLMQEVLADKTHSLYSFATQFYTNNDTLLVFDLNISDYHMILSKSM